MDTSTDTTSSSPELSIKFLAIFKKKGEELKKDQQKHELSTLPTRIDTLLQSLKEMDTQVNTGLKEFGSYLHLDDIVLSGGIKKSEKVEILKGIGDTIELIRAGHATFVKPAKKLQEEVDKSGNPELAKKKVHDQCLRTVNGWLNDVPKGLLDEAPLIKSRVTALNGTPEEKAQIKKEAEKKIAGLKSEVDDFKKVIASHSSRSFERTDPFATRMLTSLTPEEQKKIYPVWEKLALAGQEFLDASMELDKLGDDGERGDQKGTRYDFKALYEQILATGLPQAWWPPRLVEQVQAWRKASRVHNAEKSKKPKPNWQAVGSEVLGALGQLSKMGGLAGSIAAFDASFDPEALPGAPIEPDKSAERFTMMVGVICSLTDGLKDNVKGVVKGEAKDALKEMLTFDETIDLSDRLDQLLSLLGKSGDAATTVMDLVANIEKVKGTELGKLLDAKVVPGLGLAVHIIKLATAIKAAADSAMLTAKTKRLGVTSEQQDSSGLRQDGGVTTKSLDKAVKSQQQFTARKGLEIFVESTQVTAQAVILSGVSAPAGYGLSIAATGIELAGAKVFDGIDWSQAKAAKKLLEQARAGSPVAQQMLFEKCELYAKLYLAILVREADPLGEKYIKDRGITQDSLDNPTSIWLLGEALRDAVQKEDDTEIDDNLLMHLGGPLARLGKMAGGAIVDGVSMVVEKGRQVASSDYDANWKAPATVDLNPANWATNKDSAVDVGGLRNDASGVGDALTALKATTDDYDKVPLKVKGGEEAGKQIRLKQISKVLQQAGIVRGVLSNYRPVQGKDRSLPHDPMASVLEAMRSDVDSLVQQYKLRAAGIQGVVVSVGQDGSAVLDIAAKRWAPIKRDPAFKAAWSQTWKSAVDTVGLADEDHDVAKLLETLHKQWPVLEELENSSQIVGPKTGAALYKARKGTLDALKAAVDALGLCARSVVMFPNLAAFVAGARDDLAKEMRAIDDRLCGAKVGISLGSKPSLPAHDPASTAKDFSAWAGMWLESWKQASDLGFCSADGGNELSIALNAFGTAYAASLATSLTAKDRPEKRDAALIAGGKVLGKCDLLFQNEPYAPDVILALARGYVVDATDGRSRLIKDVSEAKVLDPAALKSLQDAVPGKIPDDGKGLIVPNEELQKGWEAAYEECLKKGVASKSDSGAALGKQLGVIKTAMQGANKLLVSGKCAVGDLDALYAAFDNIRKQINAAIQLVNKLLAAPGFAANDQIMDLLSVVGAEFGNYLAVIEDRRGKIELSGATLHEDEFSKIKGRFVKQRLAPDRDTGLSDLLKKVRKTTKPSDVTAYRTDLDVKLGEVVQELETEMQKSIQDAKSAKPPGVPVNYAPWIAYLRELKKQIP